MTSTRLIPMMAIQAELGWTRSMIYSLLHAPGSDTDRRGKTRGYARRLYRRERVLAVLQSEFECREPGLVVNLAREQSALLRGFLETGLNTRFGQEACRIRNRISTFRLNRRGKDLIVLKKHAVVATLW
jgi:hypothetical protein